MESTTRADDTIVTHKSANTDKKVQEFTVQSSLMGFMGKRMLLDEPIFTSGTLEPRLGTL